MKQTMTMLAVVLWTVAATLLIFAVGEDDSFRMSQIALFVQLTACMPTLYLIFDHVVTEHRQKVLVQLAQVVGRADAERANRRLRDVSH